MSESKVISLDKRAEDEEKSFLEQLLREGAHRLLQEAIENEVMDYILITSILVELNERRLPRFRSLLATTCALLPGATVPKTTSLHLQLAS